ncbi:MAG: hypothetical protein IKF17_00750 [Clostridia bacterium]|nr:hypothetical protein [Clostridia bacterium]
MKKDKTVFKFNILAVVLIIIFCVSITPITLQNDTYYTISIGEHILKNGIDMHDPFSWHNIPYTYPHWGYDVLIYIIYSWFGMVGIYIATCFLSSILGLAIYGVNCKLAKNHVISFLITMISMFLLKDYIAARAQLVTFILFILTIYCIEMFLETKKKYYAASLVIISIIIANVHVAVWPFYFILFMPYLGEYIFSVVADTIIEKKYTKYILKKRIEKLSKKPGNEEKIAKMQIKLSKLNIKVEAIKTKRKESKKNPYKIKINKNKTTRWLIVILIICVLTGLLTPLGDTPYTYLAKTMQGNTTKNINEHLPMTIIEHEYVFCLLIAYIALLTFTTAKIELKDLLMICGLAYLMLASRRQVTMFVLIGSVVINRMMLEAIETNLKKDVEKIVIKKMTTKTCICIISALVLGISLHFIDVKKDDQIVDEKSYPVAACDYILKNIDINKAKFYNDYNYGSYMLYRGIPVFIDSRADLYAPEFNTPTGKVEDGKDIFMDFMNVSSIATYYDTVFDNYQMTHVITTKYSKLAMLINNRNDKKYKELYSDNYFIIYAIDRT